MKLSSLLLLSLGSVNAQEENTDLSQLQALLKLPGAQELLGNFLILFFFDRIYLLEVLCT